MESKASYILILKEIYIILGGITSFRGTILGDITADMKTEHGRSYRLPARQAGSVKSTVTETKSPARL
jgi:hypothetical protein